MKTYAITSREDCLKKIDKKYIVPADIFVAIGVVMAIVNLPLLMVLSFITASVFITLALISRSKCEKR